MPRSMYNGYIQEIVKHLRVVRWPPEPTEPASAGAPDDQPAELPTEPPPG